MLLSLTYPKKPWPIGIIRFNVEDIVTWEKEHKRIPDNTIILFRTGYGEFYPNREKYFGTPKTGLEAIPELHFPGISPETTQWLVEKRNIKALGLDTQVWITANQKNLKPIRFYWAAINQVLKTLPI